MTCHRGCVLPNQNEAHGDTGTTAGGRYPNIGVIRAFIIARRLVVGDGVEAGLITGVRGDEVDHRKYGLRDDGGCWDMTVGTGRPMDVNISRDVDVMINERMRGREGHDFLISFSSSFVYV